MKIVINNCYGGFWLPDKVAKMISADPFSHDPKCRTNETLIQMIERKEINDTDGTRLRVIEIPDEVTDWMINDYDGAEEIIYVLDGKIRRA